MPTQIVRDKFSDFHTRYSKYYNAWFFAGGFIFDVITLDRVDNIYLIIQQAVYIVLIGVILHYQTLELTGHMKPGEMNSFFGRQFQKLWKYHNEVLHFVLGSLLSAYMLFYFVSSSLATSFVFLGVMFGLLVANELPQIQRQGPWMKYILYSICIFSFFSLIVPLVLGFSNFFTLVIAVALGCLVGTVIVRAYIKRGVIEIDIKKNVMYPIGSVGAALLLAYFLKLLPPLPISIQYIGIYHGIEKQGDKYLLQYDRPWYKFWQYGDQSFEAMPGDKPHCFVRIFSPSNFNDTVIFHWMKKGAAGWESRDRIPIAIRGGRDEGFRGYSVKGNYDPGVWRVQVETDDGREIGRINFEIETVPEGPREFAADIY